MEPETPSRLTLERWSLDELAGEELAALEAQLEADPTLRAHAEQVRASVLEPVPAAPVFTEGPTVGDPLRDVFGGPAIRGRFGVLIPAVAAFAAVLLVALFLPEKPAPDVRFRGALDVQVQRIRGGSVSDAGLLLQGQEGDRIQYRVMAPADGWISVFDLQDDGELATWTPPTRVRAQRPLDGAVLLDDYAGSERIFFVFSGKAVDLAAAKEARGAAFNQPLAELDRLPGLDATQRSILLVRE